MAITPSKRAKIKSITDKSENELFEKRSQSRLIDSRELTKLIKSCNISSDLLLKIESALGDQILISLEQESIDTTEFNNLKVAILKNYNLEMLTKLDYHYFNHFYSEKTETGRPRTKKLKKDELVQLFSLICLNRVLFEKLFSMLSQDVREVLHILVWQGASFPAKKLIDELGAPILHKSDMINNSNKSYRYISHKNPSFYIADSYSLFNFESEYSYPIEGTSPYRFKIFLDETLRRVFKKYLPKPEGYELTAIELTEKPEFVYCDNDNILSNLELLKNYILQGYIQKGNNGRLLKNTIKQIRAHCHIKEFYDEKDKSLQFIRTEMMMNFLIQAPLKVAVNSEVKLLKSIFKDFFENKNFENYILCQALLTHIKKINFYENNHYVNSKIKGEFSEILRSMPLSQWVSIENILEYALYRDLFIGLIDNNSYILMNLYMELSDNEHYKVYNRYSSRTDLLSYMYHPVLRIPFIKGMMFLLASFGIVDIAYNYPSNQYKQKERYYLTEYDGLRYVRLTQLGAFILGITDNYEVTIEKEEANIILEENRLMISMEGNDPFKSILLDKIAEKIHGNSYKVTYSSFLKDCHSTKAVEEKIKLFKKHIAPKPSEIWQTFFKELQGKINPLTPNNSLAVYEIEPSSELINLIAKDEVLRKYILKAERYHIVIDTANRYKIKKRLEEFGFFIDNI